MQAVKSLHIFGCKDTQKIDICKAFDELSDQPREQLKKLYAAVKKYEAEIADALMEDLGKSAFESYMCETGLALSEISYMIRHTKRFSKEVRVKTPLAQFASRSYKKPSPYGNVLIMSPWNYPFMLTISPLSNAISAGNTAVVKPSAYSPATSRIVEKIVSECFEPEYVAVVTGGRAENTELLNQKFDMVFFTGSQNVGREVLRRTAENLTPAVLELGGKSPCIIDDTANIEMAARRISWEKTLNSGQTCIAPDYVLIHKSQTEEFVKRFEANLKKMHGESVKSSAHFVRMVNPKEFNRVSSYLKDGEILLGGNTDEKERYIEPTLLKVTDLDSPVMSNEIFGPILPVIEFEDKKEALDFINQRPKPLAFYYFGEKKNGWEAIKRCTSGGACLNDTIMHIANENSPFGGVGNSGLGCYHGKDSFAAFSHKRTVIYTPTWLDVPFRYMPYSLFKYIKFLL